MGAVRPGGMSGGGVEPDTIAAVATAPGRGAVAIVRLSGPDTLDVLRRVAPTFAGAGEPVRRPILCRIVDPVEGEAVDRALVTYFAGPESYTGEDGAEISGHGGVLVPRLVLEACLAAGARLAEPGEFTRRAYLNGKMDLVQVEAVADLVEARGRALHRAALGQLERGLSHRISALRERLVHLDALLIHHLDFPEEDDQPVPLEGVAEEGRELVRAMEALLRTAPEGELLREGALVVLAGRPNTGKSSLFNALVGRERAIVTDIPGTTRDAVEAAVSIGGFPFRVVDTAGLREGTEAVEVLGIEVARRYLSAADVVLFCAPRGELLGEEERVFLTDPPGPVILVRTMMDREGRGDRPPLPAEAGGEGEWTPGEGVLGPVGVSVRTGQGLDELRDLLPSLVYRGLVGGEGDAPVLTRRRQIRGLRRARDEVAGFVRELEGGVPVEMAASRLRPAETALEEVLGVITQDEVLDHLFRDFCIGK